MRVCFLDIDGVLNSSEAFRLVSDGKLRWASEHIDPRAVALLNELCAGDVRIVVSSTWRVLGRSRVRDILHEAGVTARVLDVTPDFHGSTSRALEIAAWLRGTDVDRFVIVDDDHCAGTGMEANFVLTDYATGLTKALVDKARAILFPALPEVSSHA